MPPDLLEAVFLENAFYVTSDLRLAASHAMKKDFFDVGTDQTTKRLLFLSIHQQVCMALEDVGALMLALQEKKKGKDFLTVLTRYRSTTANLSTLISGMDEQTVADTYGFGPPVPELYEKYKYSEAELRMSAANFVGYIRSLAGIQAERDRICNKLKHAGTAVFLPSSPDILSILDWDRDEKKVRSEGVPLKESELHTFLYIIAACSLVYKEIAFRLLAQWYPAVAEKLLKDPAVQENQGRIVKVVEAELEEMKKHGYQATGSKCSNTGLPPT